MALQKKFYFQIYSGNLSDIKAGVTLQFLDSNLKGGVLFILVTDIHLLNANGTSQL